MKYVSWFWHNTAGARTNMVLRVLVGIAQVVLGLSVVWLSKNFIDVTIRTGSNDDVAKNVIMLLCAVIGGVVLRQIGFYLTVSASARKTNELRLDFYGALFKTNLYGDDRFHSGDVTSRLMKDVETVCNVSVERIPQVIVTTIQLVGAFLMMRWFDPRLAWVLLLLSPAMMVLGKLIAHKLKNMTLQIRKDESRVQMHVQESVEHNEVLRSLGSEGWMSKSLDDLQQGLLGNVLRRTRFTTLTRFLLGSAFGLGYILAFIWGGLGLRSGAITFGVMTSFLQLVGQIQQPIFNLLNMAPDFIHATASVDRLDEIRENSQKLQACALERTQSDCVPAGILFKDVSFKYDGSESYVVKNFSHEFTPGSKTAIMGATGIGKTTLFRLILGFVEPSSGTVVSNKSDLVLVPQGNSLMSGSIRFNLGVARPDASDDELWHALHIACADFVKDLPLGLDTELGERGVGLSEGQAQRIAIARGLLRQGSVMLLDEISSALDESTEAELYRRLFDAFPQKTFVLITHRSVVGKQCDVHLTLS